MLAKIVKNISFFSDNDTINSENYMEAINFIDTVYKFVNKLKLICPIKDISFMASFKGRMTCEKFNLSSNLEENEMKYFITKSAKFLEDDIKKESKEILGPICKLIEFEQDIIKFTLI